MPDSFVSAPQHDFVDQPADFDPKKVGLDFSYKTAE
jgi:hypothetical protein